MFWWNFSRLLHKFQINLISSTAWDIEIGNLRPLTKPETNHNYARSSHDMICAASDFCTWFSNPILWKLLSVSNFLVQKILHCCPKECAPKQSMKSWRSQITFLYSWQFFMLLIMHKIKLMQEMSLCRDFSNVINHFYDNFGDVV